MAMNLDARAGEQLRNNVSETGERGAGSGASARGLWVHAARLARMCALSPYRRTAVDCLWLRPGDTAVDLGCSSVVELEHLHRAVGDRGQVLVVESEEISLERVSRWISRHRWANVHPVRANLDEYQIPAEVGGILIAGAVVRVGDLDIFTRRAATTLRTGGRLVVLDSNLVRPRWPSARDGAPGKCAGRGRPAPVDLYLWKILSRHMAPALFMQRLFGAVFMVAGESR